MRCKQIQELLKSDYLDGEATQREQVYIKEHLTHCQECRTFEKELEAQRMLFQKTRQQVPEGLWKNIQDSIVTERLDRENKISWGIFKGLKVLLFPPRPAFVFSSVLTGVIFVIIFAGSIIQKKQYFSIENSAEILSGYSLNSESEVLLTDLGTSVEEYFL
ncbi:MAG: zf-HC2 domain-containing protein [Candidatus Omnitrophota bacterium]